MAPDLAFERETITPEFLDEIERFLNAPDLDRDLYMEMGALSLVNTYTIRKGKDLLGFALFSIHPDPKIRGNLHAIQENYAVPDAITAERFVAFCDADLKKDGIDVVYRQVGKDENTAAPFERSGYAMSALIFSKVLA